MNAHQVGECEGCLIAQDDEPPKLCAADQESKLTPTSSNPIEGLKFDTGKIPLELLPLDALFEIAKVLRFGASKYAPRNWEKGIHYGRVFAAAVGHLSSWFYGDDDDEETGLNHLAHAGCCVLFLLAFELRRKAGLLSDKFDDRPAGVAKVKR